MSDEEDNDFIVYGTVLDPLDEETITRKKAFTIEDQIATDENGRRRFHGAFTGGFSAGFFNTVGSLEGWKPSEFKSSRSEKAHKKLQKPEDFMDAEDMGAFGIAPKQLRATDDYTNIKKRKRVTNNDGPIPGLPVLHTLLQPANETVGIKLLRRMGWKPGQGVGPRLTKSQKMKAKREHNKHVGKVYGCEIPKEFRQNKVESSESESSDEDTDITFAPDDYDAFIYKPKDNTFGMGYSGLSRNTVLSSHISLFEPELKMQDRNKKVAISGQAFGVGAFEEEDEDIYSKDDMTKYDFELEAINKKTKLPKNKEIKPLEIDDVLEGFIKAKISMPNKKSYPPPEIPKGFTAIHGARISRFEPLPETHKYFNYDRSKQSGRHDLTATDRSKIINSENSVITDVNKTQKTEKINNAIEKLLVKPVDEKQTVEDKEKNDIQEKAKKLTENLNPTPSVNFKPFIMDPEKQKRYECYLTLRKNGDTNKLSDLQPASMAEWEKEREAAEFDQAARIFKPSIGLVFDRFVSASNSKDDLDPLKPVTRSIYEHGTPEMREAAQKKMFGPLTRVELPWKPHKLLCKRFNVPEPNLSEPVDEKSKKKRGQFNIFDYYEAYQQNKNTPEGPNNKELEKNKTNESKIKNIDVQTTQANTKPNNIDSNFIEKSLEVSNLNKEKDTLSKRETSDSFKNEPSCSYVDKNRIESPVTTKSHLIHTKEILSSNKNPPKITKDEEIIPVPTDPEAKKDLFKAIFLDSESENDDNEEDEQNEDKDEEKLIEMKKSIMEQTKPTKEIPKPTEPPPSSSTKKGFFADFDLSVFNKKTDTQPEKTADTQNTNNTPKSQDDNLYGPKLPAQIPNTWKPTFNKLSERKTKSSTNDDGSVWIESSKEKDKKHKYEKKHKKHKEKHKKHKSKHKKKH